MEKFIQQVDIFGNTLEFVKIVVIVYTLNGIFTNSKSPQD